MEGSDKEFDMFLAQKLSMTVRQLHREMSGEEYMWWGAYYSKKALQQEMQRIRGR